MTPEVTHTGTSLRTMREAAGLTQAQVARAMGVRRATITDWERQAIVSAAKAEKYLRTVREMGNAA